MDQTVPTPAPSNVCTNCGTPMSSEAAWCAVCGQKAYKGPPGFWRLLGDFVETVFSLDNRLFRTLAALAVPGRLTNYFLAGRQKPYFHPLRLFFVSGVLMVATYSFYTSQEVGDRLDRSLESRRAQAYQHRFGDELREGVDSIKASYPDDSTVAAASDSLLHLLGQSATTIPDSFFIGFLEYKGGLTFTPRQIYLLYDDYQILSPAELATKHDIVGTFNQYLFGQIIRINRLNLSGLTAMMGQIIWGLLLLVPLAAALLKLLYIRRKRRYVEHFIFTLHTHAFVFLAQFLAALGLLFFRSPWMLAISGVATIFYFLFALKRVYGQRWGKTIIKALLLGWGYTFLVIFVVSVTAMVAVLVF